MSSAISHLEALSEAGTSIWLDDLSRDRLQSGSLQKLIDESYVVGVTTNPSIFSAAISGSTLYKEDILALKAEGLSPTEIVAELTTSDVRNACDLFLESFIASNHVDGRVSIEVDPDLAYDTTATVERALYLSRIVNRPNVLIKVPATLDGLPAIEELTARGISVNVTLIFSVERYKLVVDAYLRGLERRVASGLEVNSLHSVASFFVSRIDATIDKQLDSLQAGHPLRGLAAIANARLAYEAYLEIENSPRWSALKSHGAHLQRPLWASTGVKDKAYSPTRYVLDLVAPSTVNTMPEGTLDAVRAAGDTTSPLPNTVTPKIAEAHAIFARLAEAGINMKKVVADLEDDGLAKFEAAWQELLANVATVTDGE